MSKSSNTDGAEIFPPLPPHEVLTMNALESIENAIAFNVRDWSTNKRDAWIYAIVFGWEDGWEEIAREHHWDEDDRKRAEIFREQWERAKEYLNSQMN